MPPSVVYSWTAVILWIGLYQCLLLAFVLWWMQKNAFVLLRHLLAAFIMIMGVRIGVGIIHYSADPDAFPLFLSYSPVVNFLYGPLFYFIIRAFIERNFRFQPIHLLHLIPSVAMLAYRTWEILAGYTVHQTFIEIIRDGNPPLPFQVAGGLMILLFAGYMGLGIRQIVRINRHIRSTASFSDPIHLNGLIFLAVLLSMPFISLLLTLGLVGAPRLVPYPAFGISLMMSIMVVLSMVRPDIFEGLPDLLMVNEEKELEPRRYESSSLGDGQKERIHSQLLAHMEAQKPWLNQELTLNELAGQLNLNARYLSQVINERQQQNFMDFINGYRIRRAQELLCHPSYAYFTVLAIAQEVGFKSRSAFYTAFKEITGKTPTAYREERMQAGESVS